MSLIDGLILYTLDEASTGSKHALLMEFYDLDRQRAEWIETRSYKERFHSLEFHFMEVRATAILYALNIN